MSHPGIRLKITGPAGPVLDVDSDYLHLIARFRGGHPWHEVFPGDGMAYAGSRDLIIEVQTVDLPDEYSND